MAKKVAVLAVNPVNGFGLTPQALNSARAALAPKG